MGSATSDTWGTRPGGWPQLSRESVGGPAQGLLSTFPFPAALTRHSGCSFLPKVPQHTRLRPLPGWYLPDRPSPHTGRGQSPLSSQNLSASSVTTPPTLGWKCLNGSPSSGGPGAVSRPSVIPGLVCTAGPGWVPVTQTHHSSMKECTDTHTGLCVQELVAPACQITPKLNG